MKHRPVSAWLVAAGAVLAACSDSPSSVPVGEQDREACTRLNVQGTYAGDVSLAKGAALKLAAGRQLCLVLPGSAAEQYALAYVDTRLIEAARNAPEPATGDSFRLTVGAAGNTRGTRLIASPAATVLPPDVREVARTVSAASGDPTFRATPWAVGDTFRLLQGNDDAIRAVKVHRVYDGWLVIAARTDTAEPALPGMLQNLDATWPSIRNTGLPMLRKALADRLPVTSAGSGQLLVVVRSDIEGAAGVAFGATDGTSVFSHIALLPYGTPASGLAMANVLFHEITHTFQRQFIHDTRPAGAPATPAAGARRWGVEGGASFAQVEFSRRLAGVGWASNWDFRNPAGPAQELYQRFAYPGRGAFAAGYSAPATFMRDLAERRTRRGEAVDDAVGAVLRGSVEGWFGHNAYGPDRTGLASRMRSLLGEWEPEDALLTWSLSHAADDRAGSSTYQDAGFLRVWDSDEPAAWTALAQLTPGSARVTVGQMIGSTGYFELAGGGTYSLASTQDGIRWMIIRLK